MTPRVVLVHDWLTGMRGGERVLLELCRMYPAAPVYALLWRRGSVDPEIERRVEGLSFLDRLPYSRAAYRNYLPLFPAAARSLRLPPADLVISSSHAVAKAVRKPPGACHISYIHTPMRYAWNFGGAAASARGWKRWALAALAPGLRRFDRRTAAEVDAFVANSENVRRRIARCYGRDAVVAPPPVDTDFFHPARNLNRGGYYLLVSALEPYKRVDVALEAFRRRRERLVVAGEGTLSGALRRRYGDSGDFRGRIPDDRLRELYQRCRAFVFPAEEDFGMALVEAQACGKPVVALGRGGALETVVDGETGILFAEQSSSSLLAALERVDHLTWDAMSIRRNALRFSRQAFRDRMKAFVESRLGAPSFPPCSDVESA